MNRTDLIPEQLERFQLIFLIHDEIACIKTARKSRNICQKIIQSGNGTIRSFQPIEIFHGYCYFDWKVELSADETQQLLKVARATALHPRVKRDAVIAYCLQYHRTFMETQQLLYDNHLPLIGGKHDRS